jgi:glycosyltransferase involved in cell wall biosynthesis
MKFSAVICTYNPDITELKKVVKSLLGLFNEILIIDDCSDTFVPKIQGTKCFKLRRSVGIDEARRMGILLAKGEFVATFNDNEQISREDIEKAKKNAEKL